MYNYYYRQNTTLVPIEPELSQTLKAPAQMPSMWTPKQPYAQMNDIMADLIELYHNELKNINMYRALMNSSPNMEEEEIIEGIIDHTNNNIRYLEQMYLGLSGDMIDDLTLLPEESPNISYTEQLKSALFSKTDTLEQYETLYRLIPIQPYKDVLFETIICQLKDASSLNYLISIQTQM